MTRSMNAHAVARLAQQLHEFLPPRVLNELERALTAAQSQPEALAGLITSARGAQLSDDDRQEADISRMLELDERQVSEHRQRQEAVTGRAGNDTDSWPKEDGRRAAEESWRSSRSGRNGSPADGWPSD